MEFVSARMRLLENLVESPPRVNAAWLLRAPPADGHYLFKSATTFFRRPTAITAHGMIIIHAEIIKIYCQPFVCNFSSIICQRHTWVVVNYLGRQHAFSLLF